MGEDAWEKLKVESIKCHSYILKTERKLYPYSSDLPVTVKGVFTCAVSTGKKTEQAEFIVIRGGGAAGKRDSNATEGPENRFQHLLTSRTLSKRSSSSISEVFTGFGKN